MVDDAPQGMLLCQRQVLGRLQENLHGFGYGATTGVTQNYYQPQTAAKAIHSVIQAPQDLGTQSITCDTQNEKVVRSLIEDQFDRDPGIRAPENGCIGTLTWELGIT